ncbi:hypothetical protein E9993_04495 [Labilibacter sediminis]|nr:hypothetical protein E9993_04495 [Labilibacter sediminis]
MKLLLTAIFCTIILHPVYSQSSTKPPRLVVFIQVDELHTEQLLAFRNKLGKYGFNQLVNKGTFYHKGKYESNTSFTGTKTANMLCGCYPETHGIIGKEWLSKDKSQTVQAFSFKSDNTLHPDSGDIIISNRLTSSIADELNLHNRGFSKIASIGLSPEKVAFFANPNKIDTYWFDRTTGNMISEADSSQLKEWVLDFNDKRFADLYIERQWGPITDLKKYHEYSKSNPTQPRHFLYDLKNSNSALPYQHIAGSPFGNIILRDFAASLIINEEYGKDDHVDLLSVSFTCKPYLSEHQELFDAEVEDMVLRLDDQIESFINLMKDNIGLEHVLVVLSSTPSSRWKPETLKKEEISTGYFNGKKTAALLNLYLMAIYGQGKWISGYHDKQFYFNKSLLEKSKIPLQEMQEKAATFLLEVSGIEKTISSYHLRTNEYTTGIFNLIQKNYYHERSGDLFISLKPGWSEEVVNHKEKNIISGQYFNSPLIFFGWNTSAMQILSSIQMIDVAATISSILQIPEPNGCIGEPLKEVVK